MTRLRVPQGNGFSIQPTAEFSAQIGNFGIGIFGVGDLTSEAVIDRQHLYVIVKDEKAMDIIITIQKEMFMGQVIKNFMKDIL
jgi:hypothetical protein